MPAPDSGYPVGRLATADSAVGIMAVLDRNDTFRPINLCSDECGVSRAATNEAT
jgi:hypothetical protein